MTTSQLHCHERAIAMSDVNSNHFRFRDYTGFRSGSLTAIKPTSKNAYRQTLWLCQCDCGNTVEVVGNNLSNGHHKSCGCRRKGNGATHGMAGTREYRAWVGMWQRCTNPKEAEYHLYKDRVPPEEWRSFEKFFEDVGPRPGPGYSLDRIDNSKPYGPGNCRWATRKQQGRNTSQNLLVDVHGIPTPLVEACEQLGLKYRLVYTRITRLGWDFQRAITQPVRGS